MRTPADQSFSRIEASPRTSAAAAAAEVRDDAVVRGSPSDGAPDALTLAGCSPILRGMETGHSPRPALAALLSALLPGLGQFYCRQWGKGAGYLVGFLVLARALMSSVDPEALQQSAASGVPVDNIGQLAILTLLLLALAVWSVVEAARSAKKSSQ